MPPGTLAELELVVLLAVMRLKGNGYGVTVMQEIADRTGRTVARGAVYITLERLEKKGFLASRLGAPSPVRGGRAKRTYEILPDGKAALERSLTDLQGLLSGLELGLEARSGS